MRKTTTRMLALILSTVMTVSSFTGFDGGSKAYAAENSKTVIAGSGEESATPGDGKIDASQFDVKLMNETVPYDGEEKHLWMSIEDPDGNGLVEDVDYTVSYKDNIYPGTAKINITYMGRYKGSAEKTFKITQAHIDGLKASYVDETSVVLSWKYLDIVMDRYVVMQYKDGSWKQVYAADVSGDSADMYDKLSPNTLYKYCVKEQCKLASGKYVDVARSSVITVRTKPYSADYTEIIMGKRRFVYDGTVKKPSFKVIGNISTNEVIVDSAKEYTYSFSNNLYPGTATLKVKYTGSSRFKGTRTEKFKIVPASITDIKSKQTADSITLTFPAIKGTTEYRLYGTGHDLDYPREEKYKVVARSKTNTITIKNRKPGSEYRFFLRAYAVKDGKEIMLAKSGEFVRRTIPAKVTGVVSGKTEKIGGRTVVRTGSDYVEIGCTPVQGADGYYIYRYDTKSKKWIKVLNDEGDNFDKKRNKVYFMVKHLKPGTGYMFKIAAYRWRWTSPDSKGELVGAKSQTIKAATVQNTKYKYVYMENAKDPYNIKLYYRVRLGGCSKNKGYYVILNKMWSDSTQTIRKPYKIVKTKKNIVNVNVPMRTSPNDPFYGITVKPYIEYGGKVFVGAEDFTYGGNMK